MKKKVLINFILIIALMLLFSTVVFAEGTSIIPSVEPSLEFNGVNVDEDGKIKTFTSTAIGTMMWAGYAIAIGMIVFIGIKYIIASADEKASMKGMLVKVVIGALIIAGSVTITNMVLTVANS